jgi:Pyruvate/2-oxoacid:ferredoxin oxidoreductase gamma subunit
MLGGLLKASNLLPLEDVIPQIERRFNPKLAERNIIAMKKSFEETKISEMKA